MPQSHEYSRPDSRAEGYDAALYARAARELAEEPTGDPLRERIYQAVLSDAGVARRVMVPLRPRAPWKGTLAVGLLTAVPLAVLAAFCLRPLIAPTFADVEQAMAGVKTATWDTVTETKASFLGRDIWKATSESQSWAQFSATPRMASHVGNKTSFYTWKRDSTWSSIPYIESLLAVDQFLLGVARNPDFISDGQTTLIYNTDRRWYCTDAVSTLPRQLDGVLPSPQETLRRTMLFPMALAEPYFTSVYSPVTVGLRTGWSPSISFWEHLQKEWLGEWRMHREVFEGRPVLRFERKAIRTFVSDIGETRTCVEDWTVRAHPITRRVVWREIVGSHDASFDYRIVSTNFRYDQTLPDGVFDVPAPEIGQSFTYADRKAYLPQLPRTNVLTPEEAAPIRRIIEQTIDAWNRRDADTFLAHCNFTLLPGGNQMDFRQPQVADLVRKKWHDKAIKGSTWADGRVKNIYVTFDPLTWRYTRRSASDPFPPKSYQSYTATGDLEAVPTPGQAPQHALITFWFVRQGDTFQISGIKMPETLKPAPAKSAGAKGAKPTGKGTPSGTATRPAGRR